MRGNLFGLVCLVLITALSACSGPGKKDGSSATGNAATIAGAAITMAELDEAAKGQLQKVDTQIYQIKRGILDEMIEGRLIEQAAKAKGMKVEEFIAVEVDSKVTPPTDDEVKALYDAKKGQTQQSFEEVKGQIRAYLEQNRKMMARRDLIARLREAADVKIMLEPPRVSIDTGDAPAFGDKGADITIVEFSDYQCPFCKRVRPTIWKLMEDYKGKIKYVFMDFPLSFHRQAKKAHEAARCAADQDKYYDYNKKLFDNQSSIDVPSLKKYAKELKLDTKEFDQCLDSDKYSKAVDDSVKKGIEAGVSGTPAFFINGIMLSGAQPPQAFIEVIEGELNK